MAGLAVEPQHSQQDAAIATPIISEMISKNDHSNNDLADNNEEIEDDDDIRPHERFHI